MIICFYITDKKVINYQKILLSDFSFAELSRAHEGSTPNGGHKCERPEKARWRGEELCSRGGAGTRQRAGTPQSVRGSCGARWPDPRREMSHQGRW